jgi:hypothetical protein
MKTCGGCGDVNPHTPDSSPDRFTPGERATGRTPQPTWTLLVLIFDLKYVARCTKQAKRHGVVVNTAVSFGRYRIRVSTEILAIVTKKFHGFLLPFKANVVTETNPFYFTYY